MEKSSKTGNGCDTRALLEKLKWIKPQPKRWPPGMEVAVNGAVYIVQRFVGGGLTGQVYQVGLHYNTPILGEVTFR